MSADRMWSSRGELVLSAGLQTTTLWGVAIAQPIYDLLSRGPEFLLAHQLQGIDLLVFVLIVSLAVPLLSWAVQVLERCAIGTDYFFRFSVAACMVVFAAQLMRLLPMVVAVSGACLLGGLFAVFIYRMPAVRTFVLILSPSALIFPAMFLLRPPVSDLFMSPRVDPVVNDGEVTTNIPIVLVVFDELPLVSLLDPDLKIDAERFPGFGALATTSWWFRAATAVAEGTAYSVPAILTGNYPDTERNARFQSYPENLFTWLGQHYSLNVIESFTKLCPPELNHSTIPAESLAVRLTSTVADLRVIAGHLFAPRELSSRLPQVTATWRDFSESRAAEDGTPIERSLRGHVGSLFEHFLSSLGPTQRPSLHYLHLNLPHIPWKYLPTGQEYGPVGARLRPHGLKGEQWEDDEWATVQGLQRHLLQLQYADRILNRLLEHLRQVDLFEQSLIIVTADHGVSFWPGEFRRAATETSYSDILQVPLLVKLPFQTDPVVSDRNIELIDIVPTISGVIDLSVPWTTDGRSVVDADWNRETKQFVDGQGGELLGRVEYQLTPQLLERTLARIHSHFGSGADERRLFAIGPFSELVGRRIAAFGRIDDSHHTVEVSDARSFEGIDLEAPYLPANVFGELVSRDRALPAPRHIAVSLNGIVRSTTQTYLANDQAIVFETLIPKSAFRSGANKLEVFEIEPNDEGPRLRRLRNTASISYRLELDEFDRALRILRSDGVRLESRDGWIEGEARDNGKVFKGWAARPEDSRAADEVLVFADGELVIRADVTAYRPDIARRFEDRALVNAGFEFVVPHALLDREGREGTLRFFAILDDLASPLPYRGSWPSTSDRPVEEKSASKHPS